MRRFEGYLRRHGVRQTGAFLIAVLALLLTVSGVGDANSTESAARYNVLAADTYAFYQAKVIRQNDYRLARDDIEITLATGGASLPASVQSLLQQRLSFYDAEIARYENEPDPQRPDDPLAGEGKMQLLALAREYEERRANSTAPRRWSEQ
jgi:hypothetical protein